MATEEPAAERMDALLEQRGGRTVYLATGTVLAVLRDGALAVEFDGTRAPVVAHPMTDARIGAGAHVLVERVQDRWHAHGPVPADLVIEVRV